MKTFIPSTSFSMDLGAMSASLGDASSTGAAVSSPGAFRSLMDGCMARSRDAGRGGAKPELPAETTAAGSEDDVVSVVSMILAGLQAAEAAITQVIPEEVEGMVSAEIGIDTASLDFAAASGMWNAVDVSVEGSQTQAANPLGDLFGKIEGVDSDAAGEGAASSAMRNAGDASLVKGPAVQEANLPDAMLEKIAGVHSDAVAEDDEVSPDMKNAGDVPVKKSAVQVADSSDALLGKIADVRSDAAAKEEAVSLTRQFQAASGRNESESLNTAASEERNALKKSDTEFTPVREPAPSAAPTPTGAGFAGAVQEAAHPAHPTSASPAAMPQRSFEVGEHSFILTRKSDTSVEVTLSPPGVGKLNIEVVLDKGLINANIVAADSKGLEAIERSLPRIVQMLADEGIAVGGFNVSLKGGGYGEKETQQADDDTNRSDSTISVAAAVTRSSVATSGLVDIFV